MKILIVGATGFIGSELRKTLIDTGISAIGLGRRNRSMLRSDELLGLTDYFCLSEEGIPNDLWDGIDGIIFLAAIRPYFGFNIDDYFYNVSLAEKYMTFAMEHHVRRFVFASTKAVYSGTDLPWRESEACVPSSFYGASKLASEQLGLYYSSQGRFSFISLRIAQVIGIGEKKKNYVTTVIKNAIEKKTQMIYGSGEQKRQYVYVKDVATSLIQSLHHPEIQGVFNIGMPYSVSNVELAKSANEVFDNFGNMEFGENKLVNETDDEMCVEKARTELGFQTTWGIKDAFSDIKKILKDRQS